MIRSLVWKEIRELRGIAALAALAYFVVFCGEFDQSIYNPERIQAWDVVPFIRDYFAEYFCAVGVAMAIALGLWQTVAESQRSTWMYLFHRSLTRSEIVLWKLAVGSGIYFAIASLAILGYSARAGLPSTHAYPFFWWMTKPGWILMGLVYPLYLGAFLSGLRPARWLGTRFFPIVGTLLCIVCSSILVMKSNGVLWGAIILVGLSAFLISLILFTARNRDFS